MYLPGTLCMVLETVGCRQKKRGVRKHHIHKLDQGSLVESGHQPAQKDHTSVTKPVAIEARDLHSLLVCHHRTDGKGVHMPMGNISQREIGKCHLGQPSACFQNLLDCIVLFEEQRNTVLLYLMGPDPDSSTIIT